MEMWFGDAVLEKVRGPHLVRAREGLSGAVHGQRALGSGQVQQQQEEEEEEEEEGAVWS